MRNKIKCIIDLGEFFMKIHFIKVHLIYGTILLFHIRIFLPFFHWIVWYRIGLDNLRIWICFDTSSIVRISSIEWLFVVIFFSIIRIFFHFSSHFKNSFEDIVWMFTIWNFLDFKKIILLTKCRKMCFLFLSNRIKCKRCMCFFYL